MNLGYHYTYAGRSSFVSGSGSALDATLAFSAMALTRKINSTRLGVKPQYTNVTHTHTHTDKTHGWLIKINGSASSELQLSLFSCILLLLLLLLPPAKQTCSVESERASVMCIVVVPSHVTRNCISAASMSVLLPTTTLFWRYDR